MGQRADTIKPWTKLGEKKWKIKANHVGRLWPFSSGAIGLNNIGSWSWIFCGFFFKNLVNKSRQVSAVTNIHACISQEVNFSVKITQVIKEFSLIWQSWRQVYHSESYLQDKIRKTLTWYLPDKLDHSRACTFVEFQIKLAKPELKTLVGNCFEECRRKCKFSYNSFDWSL